tara:strand:+ start:939 stop:1523 length:585 start_codon:yes stop_codon:yes gene_type:complete
MNLLRTNCIDALKNNKVENFFGIQIQELPFINKINLRISSDNNDNKIKCGKIIDVILPIRPNTYAKNKSIKAIWLAPDEWLITNNNNDNSLITNLRNEIGDTEASVTDVSENRTVIRISGEKIYKLLSKFLILDLEKNLPNESACAQSLFVKVPILLVRNNNESQIPEIDLFTNRSHANYIYNLIVDGSENLDF